MSTNLYDANRQSASRPSDERFVSVKQIEPEGHKTEISQIRRINRK
jgi:hypothetical protein